MYPLGASAGMAQAACIAYLAHASADYEIDAHVGGALSSDMIFEPRFKDTQCHPAWEQPEGLKRRSSEAW